MMDCPKFVEMQKMFQGENASSLNMKIVAKVKTITTDMNVVNVNVAIRSKIIEDWCSRTKEE
jgi:hypothetical protein